MVIGPAGSRAMVRTRSSLARETRPGPAIGLNALMRISYLYLMYVSTSCHMHIVLLPCVHTSTRDRVIGLSVRGAHKNQQFEHGQ